MTEKELKSAERRRFLKTAGLGAGAVGAAAVSVATTAQARLPDESQDGAGYQETKHVRTYYELARF